jgi:16S rRNA (cytosine967-C5)-methyltransferase
MAVEKTSHSDDLLRGRAVNALSAADRHLATALVLGVLRWQIRLDAQLQGFLKRPNARLDPEVRIALRLGALQLQQMDRIPARAAIDESVELTKQAGHRFASTMVNAVLRKFAALPREEADAASAHPAWMVKRWTEIYGEEQTAQICRHGQSQPRLAIRLAGAEAELDAAEIQLEPGALLSSARLVLSGDVTATDAFRTGRVRVQDEGSQLVAELAAVAVRKPEKILDACAAPGGKTLILAERHSTARILACEASEPRWAALQKRMEPLGSRVECRLTDTTSLAETEKFDLALADVPCSGTGTLGRNPEIRHRLTADDLTRQAERQLAILLAAAKSLRPGGRLIYSTCSLEPEENEQVIQAALQADATLCITSLQENLAALHRERILTDEGAATLAGQLTPQGFLKLLPGALPSDGFFIAQLTRGA